MVDLPTTLGNLWGKCRYASPIECLGMSCVPPVQIYAVVKGARLVEMTPGDAGEKRDQQGK